MDVKAKTLKINNRVMKLIFSIVVSILQCVIFYFIRFIPFREVEKYVVIVLIDALFIFLVLEIFNKLKCEHKGEDYKKIKEENEYIKKRLCSHFVFNCLNTILYYCKRDSDMSRQLILEFSNYIRKSGSYEEKICEIQWEINYIESYLFLQRARFKDKFTYNINKCEQNYNIIKYSLFNFTEICIKYFLNNVKKEGVFDVNIEFIKSILYIQITFPLLDSTQDSLECLRENLLKDSNLLNIEICKEYASVKIIGQEPVINKALKGDRDA